MTQAVDQRLGQLVPLGGGDPIPLFKPKLLIGRRESCDIKLDFPNVSSRHCELELIGGYWQIRDLASANGTKVNGERVEDRFLQPGDQIAFAKHRFELQYTPDPHAPPPVEQDPFAVSLLEKAGLARPESRPRNRPARPSPPARESVAPARQPAAAPPEDGHVTPEAFPRVGEFSQPQQPVARGAADDEFANLEDSPAMSVPIMPPPTRPKPPEQPKPRGRKSADDIALEFLNEE